MTSLTLETPKGPIAVPKEDLPKTLKIQTHVNGELRQDSSTEDLIFSIPELIETLSAGQTLRPGDVLATGTPAGVGIGKTPPVYLKPGDEVAISVTGLGTLTNKVAQPDAINTTGKRISAASSFSLINSEKAVGRGDALTVIDGKPVSYNKLGSGPEKIVFVHGLGGTKDYWTPLVSALALPDRATVHLYDFEGHGQTPTHPLSRLTVSSMANDLAGIFQAASASTTAPVTLVAHSFGCLAALKFTLENPALVKKLVLVGPPPSPLPDTSAQASIARAALVRSRGMAAVVDAVVAAGTSDASKRNNPVAVAAVRMSLLGQHPEAYAKACHALAESKTTTLGVEGVAVPTLIITGADDKVSPPAGCEQYKARIKDSRLVVIPDVGHWHVLEDVNGVSKAVNEFL
jgi:pimeloyl-ACP methyl ester carboxylesterase